MGTEADAGYYECVAEQGQKTESVASEVHVVSYGAGTCSKALPHTTAPKISQYYTTFMMEMGLDAHLKCLTVGKHSTEWLGPDEESLPVNSDKYQILPVDLDKFRQDSLTAHNAYRAKHGVPALKLNDELNDVAQEWADYLMAVDSFEHRHPNKYGENLYMSSGRAAQEQAQGAVDSWYSEIKDYTFGRDPSRGGPVTGHFTQVVWKGSSEVGVGVAQKGSKVIVVANYSPPGNYIGQHADNVFPPQ